MLAVAESRKKSTSSSVVDVRNDDAAAAADDEREGFINVEAGDFGAEEVWT